MQTLTNSTFETMVSEIAPERLTAFLASLSPADLAAFDQWNLGRSWQNWITGLYPNALRGKYAPHHVDFWNWLWNVEERSYDDPFCAFWARGGAKSTNAELAAVCLGARRIKRFVLYVCATQDQADDHVSSIASLLDHPTLAQTYPTMSRPLMGKFGSPKGWRRNRLRTQHDFTIDAIGLDTASRGVKMDDVRPDLIILDDIDEDTDTLAGVDTKITALTRRILPTAGEFLTVIFAQNMVHKNSIASRVAGLTDETTEFLADAIVSGPYPALYDAAYEQDGDTGKWQIVAGTPTWKGQDVDRCNRMIRVIGKTAFQIECQHEVDIFEAGMFKDEHFQHVTWVPDLIRTTCWIDPAVTDTDRSDSYGIQVDGIAPDSLIYRLYSWEGRSSPLDAMKRAIMIAIEWKCLNVGIETDQGGDTWAVVFDKAVDDLRASGVIVPPLTFNEIKAGAGYGPKVYRAQQMLAAYELGLFRHLIGTHEVLEKALKRFPKRKPFDLVDACYWSYMELAGSQSFAVAVGGVQSPLASYRQF